MNHQTTPTGQLIQQYREVLLGRGADRDAVALARQADQMEEEILRRMAW